MSSNRFNSFFTSDALRRLSVRLILIAFAMFIMSSMTCVTQNYFVLTYCCGILAIIVEGSMSLYYQFRGEWKDFKWFSPSIILFIVTCVPTLHVLKQHQLHVSRVFKASKIELLFKRNLSACFQLDERPLYVFQCHRGDLSNFTLDHFQLMCSLLISIQSRPRTTESSFTLFWSFLRHSCSSWRELINRLTLIGVLSDELAGFMLIEQLLLLVLVLVNWIWPQTESSDEVYFAQMLRQYLAAAPDIVEFYGNFHHGENLNQLQDQHRLRSVIFLVFILSMLQFSMNLQMKIKPTRTIHQQAWSQLNRKQRCLFLYEWFFGTSMWSVIYITLTQDLPFLVIRWYFLAYMSDSSNKMVFFLMKYALTIIISLHSGVNDMIDFRERMQKSKNKRR